MERLRFDPYSPASVELAARRIGYAAGQAAETSSGAETAASAAVPSPVAAARELRESLAQEASAPMAETPQPQQGLAQAFVKEQRSVFPQYEALDGWSKGTIFVSLNKPLEGVNRCGK